MSTGQTLPLQKPPGYRDPTTHPSPPPKSAAVNLPPSFHPKKKTRCRSFCCCLCITLATVLVLFLLAGGLFYLIFQPRLPVINIKSLKFSKSNITITPGGPTLDAESTIEVELKNPNKNLKVKYDRTRVSMNAANGGPNLGEGSVPGFVQEKGGVRILKFVTKADNVVVDEKTDGELRNKNLGVNVVVRTGVGMQGNGWSSGSTVDVKVFCQGVTQGSVAPPKCHIIQILNIGFNTN